ncbi:hypothetical protein BC937DRAFT_95111 [Endogone sp. FLAS-F59071]|nr:hypothetical protein BC937DRAFT_95111 [Endogone sp. FLAS-F59071]|eukprot:RUS13570.1 hypothetical protein BC937DRAFT_95111 [Endogone sp. FLAS-F59071]
MASLLRRLNTFYNASFTRRPMLTLCITNASLGIVSDLLAQSITYVDYKRSVKSHPSSSPDLEGMLPERLQERNELKPRPPQFDPWRTARFAVYGFCIAPVVGKWFQFLDRRFPLPAAAVAGKVVASPKSAIVATIRRVVCI